MPITTAEELAQRALDFNLLDQWQMQNVWGELGSQEVTLDALRRLLLGRDLLTYFQIEHILAEDRDSFFYGDYKILYLVGTGTFARVYRAVNPSTGQIVAVKALRKRFAEVKEEAERFHREGVIGMTLKHPNIVPIFSVGNDPKYPHIVIEFIEGRNLREFMKVRKIFEPLEATRLMLDVCKGLAYAASKGLYHRDLKMSNVLVSSEGQAKLVDFGLAGTEKPGDDIEKNPNPRAIDYAGLERSSGVPKNDPRSDIFFVGCMYYQMLSGVEPMTMTKDRMQRLSRSRYQDIQPISQVKPDIRNDIGAVVHRAIQFNAERRYQTPGEMAADLQAVLNGKSPASGGGRAAPGKLAAADEGDKREGLDAFGNPRKLMVIEGDATLQNAFREKFKRNGYRVLMTSDPQRALSMFADDLHAFDLALFSTGEIGSAALDVFNAFGENERTKDVPAVLLLGDRHGDWKAQAKTAPHRLALTMPVTVRQLRQALVAAQQAKKAAEKK